MSGLIRVLIARASATSPLPQDGVGQVILDTEVDGVRCLLTVQHPDALAQGRADIALSPRELEVAHMVACGHPNKTIAATLGISPDTVSSHIRRIFAKLGVHTRAAMIARVVEKELAIARLAEKP